MKRVTFVTGVSCAGKTAVPLSGLPAVAQKQEAAVTIEEKLGPPIPEHAELAEPGWWSCEHPERPADGFVQFRRECRRCLPAYMAAKHASNGKTVAAPTRRRIAREGSTPAEWRAWFMRED